MLGSYDAENDTASSPDVTSPPGQRTPSGQRCWRTKAKHLASSSSPERLTRSGAAMMAEAPRASRLAARAPAITPDALRTRYPDPPPRNPTRATRDCFKQYGLLVDKSGWYGSMWRPFHLIGLETSVSVLSAVLRNEPTGTPTEFRGDAVATAKRDLKPGEMLDGEGGYAVWANAIPATKSLAARALPIGLAHNVKLKRPVAKDALVSEEDVELDPDLYVVELR